MKKEKISGNMILGEVVMKYPETIPIFFKYGLPCAMCHLASGETISQGAASHGIELKTLLDELNKEIGKKKKK